MLNLELTFFKEERCRINIKSKYIVVFRLQYTYSLLEVEWKEKGN
jgi:hypothetical protein